MKYFYETLKGLVLGGIYLVFLGMTLKFLYMAFMFGWEFMQWTM